MHITFGVGGFEGRTMGSPGQKLGSVAQKASTFIGISDFPLLSSAKGVPSISPLGHGLLWVSEQLKETEGLKGGSDWLLRRKEV